MKENTQITENHNDPIHLMQNNILTNARYDISLITKRILYQIIDSVRSNFSHNDKFSEYKNFNIPLNKSQLLECSSKSKVKEVYAALDKLNELPLKIDNDKKWLATTFINYAEHDKKRDIWEVEVSKKVMPYLVELTNNFTSYDLTVALSLQSTYSQRLYELCSQYKHLSKELFFVDISRLREMFCLEDKYERLYDLRKYVLDVAMNELKNLYDQGQCDIHFDYYLDEKTKKNRHYTRIFFRIFKKEDEKIDIESAREALMRVSNILTLFFTNDPKYCKRVIKEMQLRPNTIVEIRDKLENKIADYKITEVPAIIRTVLREDFGMN